MGIDGLGGARWMERGARWGRDPPARAASVVGAPPCCSLNMKRESAMSF